MYSKEELALGLGTKIIGRKFFVFDTIDSTNACARALGDAGTAEGSVVVTDYQSSGRGRLGRSWTAVRGANLLFSVLLRPQIKVENAGLLTLYASAAIARAIERHVGLSVECKWPNDLLLNGRKFSGILLENLLQQSELSFAVIGAGINVNQRSFPDELSGRATSLCLETGRTIDRKSLLRGILTELDSMYTAVRHGEFDLVVSEWTKRCSMFGKPVAVLHQDTQVAGIARRLNHDAGLVIETSTGHETVYAGDVTLLPGPEAH
jgi:BirA family biotin operon repressor/biotin-[acetyl-CoA-carboxylase] ligase